MLTTRRVSLGLPVFVTALGLVDILTRHRVNDALFALGTVGFLSGLVLVLVAQRRGQ